MLPQSWYKYLVRVDLDVVYCDHLACCLLSELINKQQNPILTSVRSLSDLVNHQIPEIKHSLELLKNLELLQITYPTEPEKLLSGAIAIHLNQQRINQITNCDLPSRPRLNARDGIVYVIRAGHSNLYKIGRTTNIDRRLRQLQNMNSQPLTIVTLIRCHDAIAVETCLHQKFKLHRRQGEWFELTPTAIEFINNFSGSNASLFEIDVFNQFQCYQQNNSNLS
ncbi:GIY-YIG nuclease family protein [Aerosakkonemataceae cyanobacterium BLCC-F50]|uniref:GIY-YIG nuclease family protein n=1 Tax=Floridaenema flaviceps BLCC-F50 TaxID=3153642 RepID=A0ABV4XL31_9CYAN